MKSKTWIWKETAEVIGVLGVIASLIFVALEIRQNTDAVRSAMVQDISRWSYDATALMIENPEILRARQAACSGGISNDQRMLLSVFYSALLRIQLNRYQQVQLGILDEELALNLGGRGGAYRNPFFAEEWPTLKQEFDEGFVQFVERELVPLSQNGCKFGF